MFKNIKQAISTLLVVVMVFSMSTVAFAASGSMKVYVDNDYTGVNNAYLDRHDDVWVESWDDIREIFRTRPRTCSVPAPRTMFA